MWCGVGWWGEGRGGGEVGVRVDRLVGVTLQMMVRCDMWMKR